MGRIIREQQKFLVDVKEEITKRNRKNPCRCCVILEDREFMEDLSRKPFDRYCPLGFKTVRRLLSDKKPQSIEDIVDKYHSQKIFDLPVFPSEI